MLGQRLITIVGLTMILGAAGCESGNIKNAPYDSYPNNAPGVDPNAGEVGTSDPGYHYQGQDVESPEAYQRK